MSLISMIAQLVEVAKRPGLMSPLGRRRELAATRDLQAYFRVTGLQLVQLELEKLYEAYQPPTVNPSERVLNSLKDQAMHAARVRTDSVLRRTRQLLVQVVLVNLEAAYREGSMLSVIAEAADDGSVQEASAGQRTGIKPSIKELDKLGASGTEAANYAARRAAALVTGLDNTTREAIAQAVGKGITEMAGVGGTGRLIRSAVQDMTRYRAETIASYEMNDAFSQAAMDKMKRIGIARKRVVLAPNACPICRGNAAQGAIPVNQQFKSGQERTPFHVHCRCATVGARGEE